MKQESCAPNNQPCNPPLIINSSPIQLNSGVKKNIQLLYSQNPTFNLISSFEKLEFKVEPMGTTNSLSFKNTILFTQLEFVFKDNGITPIFTPSTLGFKPPSIPIQRRKKRKCCRQKLLNLDYKKIH